MRLMIISLSVLVLAPSVIGQPTTSTSGAAHDQIVRQNVRKHIREQRRLDSEIEMGHRTGLPAKTRLILDRIKDIYRDPTEKEMDLLSPRPEEKDGLATFLLHKDTGLIKLRPDAGCASNPYVLAAADSCIQYSMPGAGYSYSFRKQTYRIAAVADLSSKDGYFVTMRGALIQGILVNLGDIRVEDINDQTSGFSYISSFVPETDSAKARDVSTRLADGVLVDGFLYQSSLPIKNNSTYLLRSIAYEGRIPRSIGSFVYNEADWDKRRDILVAFRVIRQDEDGSVIIQWKRLFTKDAPKMKT
jgi:hypothetical protein